jgi:hypothetical protein
MSTTKPPERKAYGVVEAGQLLGGRSKWAVLRLIRAGKLDAVLVGRSYLVAHHEIERFIRFGEAC